MQREMNDSIASANTVMASSTCVYAANEFSKFVQVGTSRANSAARCHSLMASSASSRAGMISRTKIRMSGSLTSAACRIWNPIPLGSLSAKSSSQLRIALCNSRAAEQPCSIATTNRLMVGVGITDGVGV